MSLKKKKIIILHNIVAPYRQILFNELANNYDIFVIYIIRNDCKRRWSQEITEDIKFKYTYADALRLRIMNKNIDICYNIYDQIISLNPDYIVLPDDNPNLLTTLVLTFRLKTHFPIIVWSSSFQYYRPFENQFINKLTIYILNYIKKYIYKNAYKILAYSSLSIDYIHSTYSVEKANIVPGLQGYPTSLIPNVKMNMTERYLKNIFTFIGYIDKRKGLSTLLSAAQNLFSNQLRFKLRIIGDGEIVSQLKNKYINLENNIEWVGYIDGEKKYELLTESKCLILPSLYDPWGWVINEAMSIGVPCVVSEACMAKEMVDHDYIFKVNDSKQLSEILAKILEMDLEEYKSLSQKAILTSKCHTENKTISAFSKIIG